MALSSIPAVPGAAACRRPRGVALLLAGLAWTSDGCTTATEDSPPVAPDSPAAEEPAVALLDLRVPARFGARYVFTLEGEAGPRLVRACPGSLTFLRQEGASLAGTFQLSDARGCSSADAGSVEGTLLPYGDIRLDLRAAGAGANELPSSAGCAYAAPAATFSGAVNEKRLVALSTARLRCEGPAGSDGTVGLRVRISAEREFPPPPSPSRAPRGEGRARSRGRGRSRCYGAARARQASSASASPSPFQ